MAPPKLLPPIDQLLRWIAEGYTHEEITELILNQTGNKVSRSAVSVALHRAGKTSEMPRFSDEIPWKVKAGHLGRYPARMLRALGRRRRDWNLPETELRKLENWLAKLSRHGIVVAYDPDSEVGFFYVKARGGDGDDGIPIRRGITPLPPDAVAEDLH